jgi:hypothetical protein
MEVARSPETLATQLTRWHSNEDQKQDHWDYTAYLSIYPRLYNPLMGLGRFSISWSFTQSVVLLGRGISPPQGRYLHRTTQTQNKSRNTSMSWMGFEFTVPVFEGAKTVHARPLWFVHLPLGILKQLPLFTSLRLTSGRWRHAHALGRLGNTNGWHISIRRYEQPCTFPMNKNKFPIF